MGSDSEEGKSAHEESPPLWDCFIPLEPRPYTRMRRGKNVLYTDPKYKKEKEKLSKFLTSVYRYDPLDEPLGLRITFVVKKPKTVTRVLPSVKPDLDNYEKMLLDAGNGIVWRDDALICLKQSEKVYGESHEFGIVLSVYRLVDPDFQ